MRRHRTKISNNKKSAVGAVAFMYGSYQSIKNEKRRVVYL